jgi:hypothetical protein
LKPQLPKKWPYAEIKNLKVGKSLINIKLEKEKTKVKQTRGPKINIILKKY